MFPLRDFNPTRITPWVTIGLIAANLLVFVGLQAAAVVLLFCFPGLATWLPEAIGW